MESHDAVPRRHQVVRPRLADDAKELGMKHIGPLTAAVTVALTGLALATPAVAAPTSGSPTTIKVETSHG